MTPNIYIGKEKEWRTLLGVRSECPIVFVGVNPSIATNKEIDPTTNKIESYCKQYNHNGYVIINLYPQVEKNPFRLHITPKQELVDKNFNDIKSLLTKFPNSEMIACWGESIEQREYLKTSLIEVSNLAFQSNSTWYSIGELLKSGHPRHPARASLKLKKTEFHIDNYLAGMPEIKTIDKVDLTDIEKYDKNTYQTELTRKLDKGISEFNQDVLNEIVLWKVNRYSKLDSSLFTKLNSINRITDQTKLKEIVSELINQNGIGLPMASTILRFLEPNRFQIIDQRAFRVIYGRRFITPKSNEEQVDLYFEYLGKLESVCKDNSIPFVKADRILYYLDQELNKNIKLANY